MTKTIDLPKQYNPKDVEERLYGEWLAAGRFHASGRAAARPFTIVIPPPNVTGILHMGHALDNTFQDLIIRYQRMRGRNALWLPGTDHAGIATQNVVEQHLKKAEGKDRHDVGREAFVERVWAWKEQNGRTIVNQLKRLGSSCDWSRECFTLDEERSRAVRKVFVDLYHKGLIYRGEYLVNWCPQDQTALSDEEVEHREVNGTLTYIRYPLTDGSGHVTIATTRPETMLGDTAVAVSPKDERYQHLVGRTVTLPFLNREIPIIADDYIDPQFGTGCLKVTPAHDPNDFAIGKRHHLPVINIFNPDGSINANGGPFKGLDRFEARKRIVQQLEEQGLLEKQEPHRHAVGHSHRSGAMVEPMLSTQWFVSMKKLAEPAMAAVREGRIQFVPRRWEKIYFDWMENIRDWCISRQLWWGHRIPAWYGPNGEVVVPDPDTFDQDPAPATTGLPTLHQDEDVLDTWFSSWLWPFSTMGWPEQTDDLKTFYPTDVLVTGPDIIFFWVARMIMAGLEFTGREPFRTVYIHGLVKDEKGRKMSKSLGNGIDPLEMIEKYSADALRFSLVMLTAEGQDCKLSVDKIEMGRNFTNKLWNSVRFILLSADTTQAVEPSMAPESLEGLSLADRWILSRYGAAVESVTDDLEYYRFNAALQTTYAFFWHEFCDWYLELAKVELASADSRAATSRVLFTVLAGVLRLLHPVTPFVTEELWQRLRGILEGSPLFASETIVRAPWPEVSGSAWASPEHETWMRLLQDLVVAVRAVRSDLTLAPSARPDVVVCAPSAELRRLLEAHESYLVTLAAVGGVTLQREAAPPAGSAVTIVGSTPVALQVQALVDVGEQVQRLTRKLSEIDGFVAGTQKKLQNKEFCDKAPAEVVDQMRARLAELQASKARLSTLIQYLRSN